MAQGGKVATKSAVSKDELRRLMKEKTAKRIESPFAKYDPAGQLFCLLCKAQVKSEAIWTAHINGRQHQQNLNIAQGQTAGSKPVSGKKDTSAKNPAASSPVIRNDSASFAVPAVPPKRPSDKSAAKNPAKKPKLSLQEIIDMDDAEMADESSTQSSNALPTDFFDSASSAEPHVSTTESPQSESKSAESVTLLPDDFFDKPTKNIKQKLEREKHKQEEDEWSKFQKAIQEESHKSSMAVEQDDEETRKQKELEEIEEQMARWEKIHELEIKKEQAKVKVSEPVQRREELAPASGAGSSDEEDDLELLDWRKRELW